MAGSERLANIDSRDARRDAEAPETLRCLDSSPSSAATLWPSLIGWSAAPREGSVPSMCERRLTISCCKLVGTIAAGGGGEYVESL